MFGKAATISTRAHGGPWLAIIDFETTIDEEDLTEWPDAY